MRTIGFPRSSGEHAVSHGKPDVPIVSQEAVKPRTRGKGRWFVTTVVGSLLALVGYTIWTEFVRFQAYGEIQGDKIELSAPCEGILTACLVDEGQNVERGQLLAKITNLEIEKRWRQAQATVEIAKATGTVRLSELRREQAQLDEEHIDRQIEYFKLVGQLHLAKSKLEELEHEYATTVPLAATNTVTQSELVAARSAAEGQAKFVREMEALVDKFSARQRSRVAVSEADLSADIHSRLQAAEIELRAVELIRQTLEIRAPYDGKIVRRVRESGEHVDPSDTILELIPAESTKAVVYLPQHYGKRASTGDRLDLYVATLGEAIPFEVTNIAPTLVPPPQQLASRYRARKRLIKLEAKPIFPEDASRLESWMGAELSLPRFFAVRKRRESQTEGTVGLATSSFEYEENWQ